MARAEEGGAESVAVDLIQAVIVPTSTGYVRQTAERVLDALRALPLRQRMEAMGMARWSMPDAIYEDLSVDAQEALCDLPTLYMERPA